MDKNKLPNVDPVPDAGLQGLTSPGIKIIGPQSSNPESVFTISGKFVLSTEEYERLGGSPHRDLVLTILREPLYESYHPLRNLLLFHDDLEESGDNYVGWFSLDVWAYSGFRFEGTYHIRVSLGEALSNVIETKVIAVSSENTA